MEIATSRLRYWVGLVCLFVAFLWVFLAAWAVVPAAFGWRPVVIGGDSMGPTIGAGDVVVTAPHDGSPLGPGTVITYKDPARPGLVTHRIVAVQTDGFYLTKGDGNPVADSTPIDPAEVTGVGRILVPVVGLPSFGRIRRTGSRFSYGRP